MTGRKPLATCRRGGSVSSLPKGHDAWVVDDEDVVVDDWCGASDHARTGLCFSARQVRFEPAAFARPQL